MPTFPKCTWGNGLHTHSHKIIRLYTSCLPYISISGNFFMQMSVATHKQRNYECVGFILTQLWQSLL